MTQYTYFNWLNIITGEGVMEARIYEQYVGLRGQLRVGLVDLQGRVHHFDAEDMHILGIATQVQVLDS